MDRLPGSAKGVPRRRLDVQFFHLSHVPGIARADFAAEFKNQTAHGDLGRGSTAYHGGRHDGLPESIATSRYRAFC
jgi:hypothetical protein